MVDTCTIRSAILYMPVVYDECSMFLESSSVVDRNLYYLQPSGSSDMLTSFCGSSPGCLAGRARCGTVVARRYTVQLALLKGQCYAGGDNQREQQLGMESAPERSRSLLGAARKLAATFRGKAREVGSCNNPRTWFGVSPSPKDREECGLDLTGNTTGTGMYDGPTSTQSDSEVQSCQEKNASHMWQTQFSGMSARRKRVSK